VRLPTLAPWELASHKDDVLVALPRVVAAGAQSEGERDPVGDRARSLGATWAALGDAPGMTRQSAWERFSGDRTVDQSGAVTTPRPRSEGSECFLEVGPPELFHVKQVKSLDLRGRAGQDRHLMRRSGRAT